MNEQFPLPASLPAPLPAISRFPVPEPKDLPDDIREKILTVQEKAGFVPNVFLALAYRTANMTSMRPNAEFYQMERQINVHSR